MRNSDKSHWATNKFFHPWSIFWLDWILHNVNNAVLLRIALITTNVLIAKKNRENETSCFWTQKLRMEMMAIRAYLAVSLFFCWKRKMNHWMKFENIFVFRRKKTWSSLKGGCVVFTWQIFRNLPIFFTLSVKSETICVGTSICNLQRLRKLYQILFLKFIFLWNCSSLFLTRIAPRFESRCLPCAWVNPSCSQFCEQLFEP